MTQYGSYTTVITDGTNTLEIYSAYVKEGVNVPCVGDTIVAYGHSKVHNGTNELTGGGGYEYPVYLSATHNTYNVTSLVVDTEDSPVADVVTFTNLPTTITSGTPAEFTISIAEGYKEEIIVSGGILTENSNGYVLNAYSDATIKIVLTPMQEGEKEYEYVFEAKQFSANGTLALNDVNWTLAGDGGYWGNDSTKGQQFGSGSKPYKSLTLTSEAFTNVKSITINTSGANSIAGTLTVTVGGVQIGETITLTSSATEYTFESETPLSGAVVLTYSQTSSKAIYIKSIYISYSE